MGELGISPIVIIGWQSIIIKSHMIESEKVVCAVFYSISAQTVLPWSNVFHHHMIKQIHKSSCPLQSHLYQICNYSNAPFPSPPSQPFWFLHLCLASGFDGICISGWWKSTAGCKF